MIATPQTAMLRLNSIATDVTTLGPPPATVLWTQGCRILCPGCMSLDTLSHRGGVLASGDDIATWLSSTSSRNLVLSGGEPSEQSLAVHALLDRLDHDWTVTLFSGRDLDDLLHDVDPYVPRLVRRVDLAITGPYRRDRHASLLWRGSSNQALINVSGRVQLPEVDESVGVVVQLRGGALDAAIGVPPAPDFAQHLRTAAARHGVALVSASEPPTFPFPVIHPKEV
ncbi:MAG: 4Fe-4S cluster-binding domain-containing protein [Actinomycetota bacterium]